MLCRKSPQYERKSTSQGTPQGSVYDNFWMVRVCSRKFLGSTLCEKVEFGGPKTRFEHEEQEYSMKEEDQEEELIHVEEELEEELTYTLWKQSNWYIRKISIS